MHESRLPQLDGTFITDGGMETTLIFKQGMELPHFASFVLLDDPDGVERISAMAERMSDPPVDVRR